MSLVGLLDNPEMRQRIALFLADGTYAVQLAILPALTATTSLQNMRSAAVMQYWQDRRRDWWRRFRHPTMVWRPDRHEVPPCRIRNTAEFREYDWEWDIYFVRRRAALSMPTP